MERQVLKPLCLLCGENSEKWARDPPSVVFHMKNVCWHWAPEEITKKYVSGPRGYFLLFVGSFLGYLGGPKEAPGGVSKMVQKREQKNEGQGSHTHSWP